QNSQEDWLREAASMANVYQNGWINLSATHPQSTVKGLFSERRLQPLPSVRLRLPEDPRKGKYNLMSHQIIHRDFWMKLVEEATINKRAWVVQERLLSPRVLHFARDQLAWECHELEACDSYPNGIPAILDHG